jgi:hypothetical protein
MKPETDNRTALEWLEYEFVKLESTIGVHSSMYHLIEKAKEMEKEQIVEAVNTTIKGIRVDKQRKGFFVVNGEGYYARTYEANKND